MAVQQCTKSVTSLHANANNSKQQLNSIGDLTHSNIHDFKYLALFAIHVDMYLPVSKRTG